jgi:hypothetical protein
VHVVPLQQPVGQEVESQTHWPFALLHSWPDAHAVQLAPAAPHELFDSDPYASHAPAAVQQPAGQEAASQTHCPVALLHSWPATQALHVAPPAPHEPFDSFPSASHDDPLQQPPHDEPPHEQTPLEQVSPLPHALHAAPAVPHSPAVSDAQGTQVLPLQHPCGHEVASHTHAPVALLHSWPATHAAHVAPPVPHDPFDSEG